MTTFPTNNKAHGNVGNQHASKGMDSRLNINCRRSDKAAWVRQAQQEGLNLTEWVARALNARCG